MCVCSNKLIAQNSTDPTIPQENVFLHFNTSFFVSGESIYYKLYCLNTKTKKLSTLSKIAYVELIDKNLKSVFKHKVRLENGTGFGDFFIPTSISSGNYKLIAYTQWMRNWSDNYFQNDISIVNPFEENQSDILVINDSTYIPKSKIIDPIKTVAKQKVAANGLSLSIEKKNFGKREKVVLNILNSDLENSSGDYSISVNKLDSIIIPEMASSINYKKLFEHTKLKSTTFLPELRGELISGKVLDSNKKPIQNSKVAISIPGKNFLFKVATTNNKGSFHTYLNDSYENDNAIFQVLDNTNENQHIIVDSITNMDLKKLHFSDFSISQDMQSILLNRSIQSQIENSYSTIKLNTEDSILPIKPFYESKIFKTYTLDDYTRFPTVKETVVEIMPEVFTKTRKNKSTLHVLVYLDQVSSETLPMIIIDGVLVQNHEELLAYNANSIDKIHVVKSQYLYGTQIYEGIIAIETKSGNYTTSAQGNFIKYVNLFKPLPKKTYYKQVYENDLKFDRIPDYRNFLLWRPNLTLNEKDNELSFYSSDVPGYYQIRLEGFNKKGLPVSLQEIIKVN